MADPNRALQSMWSRETRYSNFGAALTGATIRGFRGISELALTFESPITAFCGTNGSGKSTVIQLLACAYKPVATEVRRKRYYIKDFFSTGRLDPEPFSAGASVEYTYATSARDNDQVVTVRRAASEWSGYKRQPERVTAYVGFTLYIPKVERKDFSVLHAQNLVIGSTRQPSPEAARWTRQILGNKYENMDFATVTHSTKETEVGRLSRHGATYSENNMGFGEGRVLYLVDLLESAPNNSMFALEEPETSLHAAAQYGLGKYLVDVTLRKKHQIFLSTHSEYLLSALPAESRKLLVRNGTQGHNVIDRVSNSRALSFLSGHHEKALIILVEDPVARQIIIEILRKRKPDLIPQVSVEVTGDKRAVAKAVAVLRNHGAGQNAIAFRDGDVGESPKGKLYSLPGTLPPEKEFLNNAAVKAHMRTGYGIDVDSFLEANSDMNHHEYIKKLADTVNIPPDALMLECVREYVSALSVEQQALVIKRIYENL